MRLTPAEHAAWTAARDSSGRREVGAWVRAVVNELLDHPAGDRGQPAREDQVDVAAYAALVRAGNNLNQLARWANTERRYPAEREARAAYVAVHAAVVEIRAVLQAAQARSRRGGR